MRTRYLPFALLSVAAGCSGGTRGCTSTPLPASPLPFGVPPSQQIAGGMQVRLTQPGFNKMAAAAMPASSPQTTCGASFNTLLSGTISLTMCDTNDCPNQTKGCPLFVYGKSGDRPSTPTPLPPFPPTAAGNEDGKDKVTLSLQPGPVLAVDRKFDVLMPIHITYVNTITSTTDSCYLYVYDAHLADNNAPPLDATDLVSLGTNSTTGAFAPARQSLQIAAWTPASAGCGTLASVLSSYGSTFQAAAIDAVQQMLVSTYEPPIDALVALTPSPPGSSGTLGFGSALSPFALPGSVDLEWSNIAGGYSQTSGGGLSVGVLAAVNSDRDPATRTSALTSEPASCVQGAAPPDLGAPPWNLPPNPTRGDFDLAPDPKFLGMPEPMVGSNIADFAIGISRAYLTLLGAHLVNSGALCASVGPALFPPLSTGALSVLLDGGGAIYADRRAPLVLTLRPPAAALSVALGAGTPSDALVHATMKQLGIDAKFGAAGQPAFSATLDLTLDFDVGAGSIDPGKPGLEPLLVGAHATNMTAQVADAATFSVDAARLARVSAPLASVAASLLAGAFRGPAALPSFPLGFSLDTPNVARIQGTRDDFLSVTAMLTTAPTQGSALDATVALVAKNIPDEAHLRALFDPAPPADAIPPSVTFGLGPPGAEYSLRIDGGAWRPWSADPSPVVTDDAFLFQGSHSVDVRARAPGDFHTEDLSPAHLDFVIDSVPPELHPSIDAGKTRVDFGGFDLVTPDSALVYAWNDSHGTTSAFTASSSLAAADALAATSQGKVPLVLFAMDEAGNVGTDQFDVSGLLGSAPPSQPGGCGCRQATGRASGLGASGLLLAALGLRRAARRRPE